MIFRVYGVDDALATVRRAGRVDRGGQHVRVERGEQRGHGQRDRRGGAGERPALRGRSRLATQRPRPGRRRHSGEHGSTTAAGVPRRAGSTPRNATASTAATTPSRAASALARSRMSPVVFSARKTAPWVRNSASVVRPPSRAYGLSRSQQAAGVLVVGVERHAAHDVGERDAPQERGHQRADDDAPRPSARFHAGSWRLPRYSKATPAQRSARAGSAAAAGRSRRTGWRTTRGTRRTSRRRR